MDESLPTPPIDPFESSSPEEAPPIQQPPPKSKFPLFISICFIIVFIAGTAGIVLTKKKSSEKSITPQSIVPTTTTNPMANWETYINNQYGYSFSYPNTVTLEEKPEFTKLTWKKEQYSTVGMVKVVDNPKHLAPTEYVETELCKAVAKQLQSVCNEEVKNSIGPYGAAPDTEEEGVTATYTLSKAPTDTYVFPLQDKIIVFEFSGDPGTSPKNLDNETIEQILSTFRFLDQVDDLDWKTYISALGNFSVSYPPTWEALTDRPDLLDIRSNNKEVIHITTQKNPQSLELSIWLKKNFPDSFSSSFVKTITIGRPSMKSDKYGVIYIEGFNEQVISVSYKECSGPGCGPGKLEPGIVDQILSTFKFLK